MSNNIKFYNAGLYIRLSDEDGDKEESDSVTNQRKLLLDFSSKQEDILVKDIYVDDGFSGTTFNRPDFKRMISDIEKQVINCVIVKDLSRFGRDYIDSGKYLERFFPQNEIRFISISDGIDSNRNEYDMMLPIRNIFNEQYARDISKKIHYTIETKQNDGEYIGAFPCYGYNKDPNNKNKLVIDDYSAQIVRRIFNLFLEGYGKQKIARLLNDEGILPPTLYKQTKGSSYQNGHIRNGKSVTWSYSTINCILHNEMYIGNMVQGKHKQNVGMKKKSVDKEKWIVVKNTHEAIIDETTWNKSQDLLKRHTRELDLTTKQHIFAGFIRCGDCDNAMSKITYMKAGKTYPRFCCGNYKRNGTNYCTSHFISFDILERIVLDDLKKIIQSISDLDELAKNNVPQKVFHDKKNQIMLLEKELAKYERIQQSLYEDYKDGVLTKEEFLIYKGDYLDKIENIKKQIEFYSDDSFEKKKTVRDEWLEKLLKYRTIDKLNRSIVAEMIHVIYVYENQRVKIVYNFSDELNLFKTNE
ncbi:MAG: recombinase family protein [Lachnospiraceae bacterium]